MMDGAAGLLWLLLAALQMRSGTLIGWLLALNSALVAGLLLFRNGAEQRGSAAEHGIAYLSALLPLAVHPGEDGAMLAALGTLFGLWVLLSLGRSFGIAPADRGIVERGPYRLVRHPLYLAALISTLGAVWGRWTAWNLGVLALLACSLGYRIRAEERILGAAYRPYRARVRWRLLPLVWGLLLLAVAQPLPVRAESADCAPVWDGRTWAFEGTVADVADYDLHWVVLHLAWVQCSERAGVWVVRSADVLAGRLRGHWRIGAAAGVGTRVRVSTPILGEQVDAQGRVQWETCPAAWCALAAEFGAQSIWDDQAFIHSGYGPAWYPWGFLFWRLDIMSDNGHRTQPVRAATTVCPRRGVRRFVLYREQDVSGVSGTGVVAEGVRFSDGRVALVWLRAPAALSVFAGIGDLMRVHGHGGLSRIEWLDE